MADVLSQHGLDKKSDSPSRSALSETEFFEEFCIVAEYFIDAFHRYVEEFRTADNVPQTKHSGKTSELDTG